MKILIVGLMLLGVGCTVGTEVEGSNQANLALELAGCAVTAAPACKMFTSRNDVVQYMCKAVQPGGQPYDNAHPYPFNPLNVTDEKCHFVAWYQDQANQAMYCCAPDEKPL